MAQSIKIEQADYEELMGIQHEKQAILTQIGACEEMKDRLLEELRSQNKRRGEMEERMAKDYMIPENMVWRLEKDATILVMKPEEVM